MEENRITLGARTRANNKLNPRYGSKYGIRTLATSVGVEFPTTAGSPPRESQGNQYFLKVFFVACLEESLPGICTTNIQEKFKVFMKVNSPRNSTLLLFSRTLLMEFLGYG